MKTSGYSSYFIGRKQKKNLSIDLNTYNYNVQLSEISCHAEPLISLEIQQDNIYNQRRSKLRRRRNF